MKHLGFEWHIIDGVEVILPPMCIVSAGEFVIGSDPSSDPAARREEQPQHHLELPAFQIGRFSVTIAEYACFVRFGQREPQPADHESHTVDWQTQLQRLDHPVVCVSWFDARDYASWLAHVTGQPWRLPTEAEWEKAARGTDGRLYPWGDEFGQWRGNTKGSGKTATTAVGSYPAGASPYGAEEMAGNVWDWTSSLYLPYPYALSHEQQNSTTAEKRVLRGGSWVNNARFVRAAYRGRNRSGVLLEYNGFRLVRASPGS